MSEILILYGECLLSTSPTSIDHQIYARTYHCLLTHYPMELTPFFAKLEDFFLKYFSQRLEDNKPSGASRSPSHPALQLSTALRLCDTFLFQCSCLAFRLQLPSADMCDGRRCTSQKARRRTVVDLGEEVGHTATAA